MSNSNQLKRIVSHEARSSKVSFISCVPTLVKGNFGKSGINSVSKSLLSEISNEIILNITKWSRHIKIVKCYQRSNNRKGKHTNYRNKSGRVSMRLNKFCWSEASRSKNASACGHDFQSMFPHSIKACTSIKPWNACAIHNCVARCTSEQHGESRIGSHLKHSLSIFMHTERSQSSAKLQNKIPWLRL